MRWSERIKLTFETFKRVALPIYGWYFIFALAGLGLLIAGLMPFITPMLYTRGSSFSSPFPNPNPPMPPGSNYSGGSSLFGYNLAPYLAQAPYFALIFGVILLLCWLMTSAFLTGMFNLTEKGLHEKVLFRDFRFSGIPRVLGWYGILTLVSFLIIVAGIVGALALQRMSSYALPLFAGLYVLLLVALGIFLAPWLLTSTFYMLHHRELSFGRSLSESWNFYRRNLGSLWLFFITLFGIQILLSLINQASQSFGFLVALLAGPFTAILPIVWVLSLEEEQNQHPPYENEDTQRPSLSESARSSSNESSLEVSSFEPSPFASDSASPSNPVNYCPTCGQKTHPDANYCAQCGTKL